MRANEDRQTESENFRHGDFEEKKTIAREEQSEELYKERSGLDRPSSPEGDSAGENKVATSLGDE